MLWYPILHIVYLRFRFCLLYNVCISLFRCYHYLANKDVHILMSSFHRFASCSLYSFCGTFSDYMNYTKYLVCDTMPTQDFVP